jgi:uncharacterized cupin superfamily protein
LSDSVEEIAVMPNNTKHLAILAKDIPVRIRASNYPAAIQTLLASRIQGREKRALGDYFGLSNFGVNLTGLAPNSVSALYHCHSRQDELIYILSGNPTLQTPEGNIPLSAGMCAGFKAASGVAHCLLNETDEVVVYLEIGDRTAGDEASYPNDDLQAHLQNGVWVFLHKDGTSY